MENGSHETGEKESSYRYVAEQKVSAQNSSINDGGGTFRRGNATHTGQDQTVEDKIKDIEGFGMPQKMYTFSNTFSSQPTDKAPMSPTDYQIKSARGVQRAIRTQGAQRKGRMNFGIAPQRQTQTRGWPEGRGEDIQNVQIQEGEIFNTIHQFPVTVRNSTIGEFDSMWGDSIDIFEKYDMKRIKQKLYTRGGDRDLTSDGMPFMMSIAQKDRLIKTNRTQRLRQQKHNSVHQSIRTPMDPHQGGYLSLRMKANDKMLGRAKDEVKKIDLLNQARMAQDFYLSKGFKMVQPKSNLRGDSKQNDIEIKAQTIKMTDISELRVYSESGKKFRSRETSLRNIHHTKPAETPSHLRKEFEEIQKRGRVNKKESDCTIDE